MYAETGVSRSPAISKGAFIRFLASNHADNKKPIPGLFRRWVLATLESFRESLRRQQPGPTPSGSAPPVGSKLVAKLRIHRHGVSPEGQRQSSSAAGAVLHGAAIRLE